MSLFRVIGLGVACSAALASCGRIKEIGEPPMLSPLSQSPELVAMQAPPDPADRHSVRPLDDASLWRDGRHSLLGSNRAEAQGDIITVIIEIDESAEFSASSDRSRSADEGLAIPQFFGIPQRINRRLPEGASMDPAVSLNSSSGFSGDGTISRNEELTLRVAATVTQVLPNGSFTIEGRQEIRLNNELRELVVTGIVRPDDISRRNTILYDKIAAARISYGGRGQIQDVQKPRYGQQIADIILPF